MTDRSAAAAAAASSSAAAASSSASSSTPPLPDGDATVEEELLLDVDKEDDDDDDDVDVDDPGGPRRKPLARTQKRNLDESAPLERSWPRRMRPIRSALRREIVFVLAASP